MNIFTVEDTSLCDGSSRSRFAMVVNSDGVEHNLFTGPGNQGCDCGPNRTTLHYTLTVVVNGIVPVHRQVWLPTGNKRADIDFKILHHQG